MKIKEILNEAVLKVPTHPEHIERLREILENPLPATLAHASIYEIIDDDDLNSRIEAMSNEDASCDARVLVVDWIKLNMPDLIQKLEGENPEEDTDGTYSPISGDIQGDSQSGCRTC